MPLDYTARYEEGTESEDREHRERARYEKTAEDGPEWANDSRTIQTTAGTIATLPTRLNIAGQTASGFRPFDPSGAVGPNHYVQMINSTTFKVYNKTTGAVSLTGTLGNLWSPATGNTGDPIVLYDKPANRWLLAQFGTSTDKKIYIAISTTGDPTGSYYTYTYVAPLFPDYLKFSVWHDGYYMTANTSTQYVWAFERTAMLAGTPGARMVYQTFSPPKSGFFSALPGDASDGVLPAAGTPCPIFSYSDNGWGATYFDRVNIYHATTTWGTSPSMSITAAANLSTAAFDASYNSAWNDCPQPGTTQKLDGIGGAMMYRAQWKTWSGYNSVVLNWAVKISTTQRGIMWVELRQTGSTWSIYQQGIYAPGTDTRWLGSIAMDNNGSIGLNYIRSNSTAMYPSLYYTGRRSCDPLGTLPLTETVIAAGTGFQSGTNRVGDYSQTVLDPDGVTFWGTSEFMGGTSGSSASRTRIFSYTIPACSNVAGVSIAVTSGTNPTCTGGSVTFTATPTNGGTAPTYQWKVNGVNVGTSSTTYTSSTLANGDVVTCVMTSNLSGVTGNPATSNSITMTVTSAVTPAVSIAITSGSNPTTSGASVTFTATPTNGGTTPSYQWKVNGTNVGTNSATYTTTTLTNGAVVSCVMTSSSSCASPTTATSNSITMTVNTSLTYCSATTTNTTFEYISNVSMGSISNATVSSGYANYTALSTTVTRSVGSSITITVGGGYSTDRAVVFVDWNQNGVFTDAGETVFTSTTGVGPYTGTITPPSTATLGATRMRIRLTDTGAGPNLTSCGSSTYGEVEDYTLNVVSGAREIPLVDEYTAPNAGGDVRTLATVSLSVFPNPNAGTFTIEATEAGTYYLLSETGQLVQVVELNATNGFRARLSELASGVYILSGQNKSGITKQKIVVTH
ncbi:MAG: GEVED domain-containing protein [Bacteroidia bacterium]